MAKTIQLNIVSLEEDIFSGAVEMVVVTAIAGEIGILPGHIPLLTMIQPGHIRTLVNDHYEIYYVSGGILEVQPTVVTILADTVVRAAEVDTLAAQAARKGTKRVTTANDKLVNTDYAIALAQVTQATRRLQAIQLLHRNRKK